MLVLELYQGANLLCITRSFLGVMESNITQWSISVEQSVILRDDTELNVTISFNLVRVKKKKKCSY